MALAAAQFQSVDLTEGKLQGTLETKVTSADPAANGQDTITVKYTVPKTSWVSFGVNPTGGGMVNAEVVIGKPDAGTVLKYGITAKAGSAITEAPNQTLIGTSIVQADGNTVLTFTKILVEEGEYPIEAGTVNTFVASFGSSNTFGFHEGYGVQNVNVPAATPATSAPTAAPVVTPTDAPVAAPTDAPVAAPTVAPSASPSLVTGSVLFTVVVSSLALLW